MPLNNEITTLKSKIQSNDPEALIAIKRLIELDRDTAIDYLITLLDSTNPSFRNFSALGLRDLADNKALEPLFKAISKVENVNSRGTLVYALETLDCSDKLMKCLTSPFMETTKLK